MEEPELMFNLCNSKRLSFERGREREHWAKAR